MGNMVVDGIMKKTKIFYIVASILATAIGVYMVLKGISLFDQAISSENTFMRELGIVLIIASVIVTAFNIYLISFITDLIDGYSLLIENSCIQTNALIQINTANGNTDILDDTVENDDE